MGHQVTVRVRYLVLLMSACSTAAIAAEGGVPYLRSSLYVPVRDGTRIAVDLYRPRATSEQNKRPVLLTMTPYMRAQRGPDGSIVPDPTAAYFASHGYVVAIGDVRGKDAPAVPLTVFFGGEHASAIEVPLLTR